MARQPGRCGRDTHYTFAHLVQRTASLQTRLNFIATPTLSFELYAEPFVSKGTYRNVGS